MEVDETSSNVMTSEKKSRDDDDVMYVRSESLDGMELYLGSGDDEVCIVRQETPVHRSTELFLGSGEDEVCIVRQESPVHRPADLTGDTSLSGSGDVTGDTSLSGSADVTGHTSLSGSADVTGHTSLSGSADDSSEFPEIIFTEGEAPVIPDIILTEGEMAEEFFIVREEIPPIVVQGDSENKNTDDIDVPSVRPKPFSGCSLCHKCNDLTRDTSPQNHICKRTNYDQIGCFVCISTIAKETYPHHCTTKHPHLSMTKRPRGPKKFALRCSICDQTVHTGAQSHLKQHLCKLVPIDGHCALCNMSRKDIIKEGRRVGFDLSADERSVVLDSIIHHIGDHQRLIRERHNYCPQKVNWVTFSRVHNPTKATKQEIRAKNSELISVISGENTEQYSLEIEDGDIPDVSEAVVCVREEADTPGGDTEDSGSSDSESIESDMDAEDSDCSSGSVRVTEAPHVSSVTINDSDGSSRSSTPRLATARKRTTRSNTTPARGMGNLPSSTPARSASSPARFASSPARGGANLPTSSPRLDPTADTPPSRSRRTESPASVSGSLSDNSLPKLNIAKKSTTKPQRQNSTSQPVTSSKDMTSSNAVTSSPNRLCLLDKDLLEVQPVTDACNGATQQTTYPEPGRRQSRDPPLSSRASRRKSDVIVIDSDSDDDVIDAMTSPTTLDRPCIDIVDARGIKREREDCDQGRKDCIHVCKDCGACFSSADTLEQHSEVHSMGTVYEAGAQSVHYTTGLGTSAPQNSGGVTDSTQQNFITTPGDAEDSSSHGDGSNHGDGRTRSRTRTNSGSVPCTSAAPGPTRNRQRQKVGQRVQWAAGIQRNEFYKTDYSVKKVPLDKTGKINQKLLEKRARIDQSRKWPCSYCGKRFTTEKCLKRHADVLHLGLTPFKCQICNRPTPCLNEQARHELRHKPEEWIAVGLHPPDLHGNNIHAREYRLKLRWSNKSRNYANVDLSTPIPTCTQMDIRPITPPGKMTNAKSSIDPINTTSKSKKGGKKNKSNTAQCTTVASVVSSISSNTVQAGIRDAGIQQAQAGIGDAGVQGSVFLQPHSSTIPQSTTTASVITTGSSTVTASSPHHNGSQQQALPGTCVSNIQQLNDSAPTYISLQPAAYSTAGNHGNSGMPLPVQPPGPDVGPLGQAMYAAGVPGMVGGPVGGILGGAPMVGPGVGVVGPGGGVVGPGGGLVGPGVGVVGPGVGVVGPGGGVVGPGVGGPLLMTPPYFPPPPGPVIPQPPVVNYNAQPVTVGQNALNNIVNDISMMGR